jgi:histidine decarboxylase
MPPVADLPPLSASDAARLEELYDALLGKNRTNIGYPCNQHFDYSCLFPFFDLNANNIGDPWRSTNYTQNTHAIECEVVSEFARLTEAPAGEFWGYITNGGTEGNMYGLYLARELHPGGMVYFSEDTHYSVAKILRLQNMRNIMIRSLADGTMDLEDLRETVRIHRDVPPIIFANVGTTMKGAIDDIAGIHALMADLAITRYYIHADAALSGMILPFVENPPAWNFAHGVDSMSISGHKMIGAPMPCGVALAKKSHVERIARSVEYVGVMDTTITGSRNAITPLMLWTAFRRLGDAGMKRRALECLDTAEYAVRTLRAAGIEAWRHPQSVTVVFPRPPQAIFEKWTIAPHRKIGHLITMPHVTRAIVDEFTADYTAALQS